MRRLLLTAVVLGLLPGCALLKNSTPPARFLLDPNPVPEAMATIELTVGVRPFASARPYALPMQYLDEAGRLTDFPASEWYEQPDRMVTLAIIDALARTERFRDAGYAADMARPDVVLTGEVRRFHEARSQEIAEAVVELYAAARHARTADTLWSGTVAVRHPVTGTGGAAFRDAMESALEDAVSQIATNVAKAAD